MKYSYKNYMKSDEKKVFINEINEIYTLLDLKEKKNNSQTEFENILIKIGIIDKLENFESFKKFIEKNFKFELDKFEQLLKCNNNCNNCPVNKYCNYYRNELVKNFSQNNYPTIIDLFCGAGGLSLGFKQENFKVVLANDIEESCLLTYMHNNPQIDVHNIICDDIKNVLDLLKKYSGKIDLILGGPPCQGFSMANRQRLIDDPRNKLYKYYIEAIKIIKPKFFIMENVKGMLSHIKEIKEDFKNIDYNVTYRLLNAKDFGVPQNRERLIFIGSSNNINPEDIFYELMKISDTCKSTVLKDALEDLKPLSASQIKNSTEIDSEIFGKKIDLNYNFLNENDYINLINNYESSYYTFNHKARYNNDRDIEIFRRLSEGENSTSEKIADIMPYSNRNDIFKDKYFKLESNKVCKTITAHMKFDCNMYIHPFQARGLTPREAARIQSYPDDYFFKGSYTKTYMQIGNSVPPLLSRAIAKAIKKFL